jgi:hypothetical protein
VRGVGGLLGGNWIFRGESTPGNQDRRNRRGGELLAHLARITISFHAFFSRDEPGQRVGVDDGAGLSVRIIAAVLAFNFGMTMRLL